VGRILIGCQGTSRRMYEYNYNGQKVKSKATFIALSKFLNDIEKIIPLMEFIEKKEIITYLSKKKIED
jgi:hypothetical protein